MDDTTVNQMGSSLAFLVGFFLSFRALITVFCVRMLGADPQTGSAIRLAITFFLLGLACLTWLDTPSRPLAPIMGLAGVRWTIIFLAFSACSLLWSETASPFASAAYWCATAADVATAGVLLLRLSVQGVATSLMKGFIWSTCLIAAVAWLMPAQYDFRLGDEYFLNANTIANLCAFAVFFAQYLIYRKDGNWFPAAVFLSVTLIRTLSKSAIAAFVVSESFFIIQDKQMGRRAKMILTASAVVIVLVFWGLFEAYYNFYTSYGNQSETLTGRTAIWAYVWDAGLQRIWVGHGFDSMWNVIPTFGTFEARHAENELLEQFYSYGIAGIAILCGVYGCLYRQFRRLPQRSLQVIFTSVILYVIVRGIAEAEPFDLLLPLWAVVLFSVVAEDARTRDVYAAPTANAGPLAQLIPNDNAMTRQ